MVRVMGTQLLKAITFVKIIGTHFLQSQIMPIRIHMHDYVTKPNICLMNMMQDNINIYHYRIRDKPKIKTFSQPRILDNFIIDLQWSTLIQLQSTCDVLPPLPLQVCNKFLTYTICRETHQMMHRVFLKLISVLFQSSITHQTSSWLNAEFSVNQGNCTLKFNWE